MLPPTPKLPHDALKLDARETAQLTHTLDAIASPPLGSSSPSRKPHAPRSKKDEELVASLQEELRNLNTRVKLLEMELDKERTVSQVVNSKNALLEREVTRLTADIDKLNFEREKYVYCCLCVVVFPIVVLIVA